MGMHPGTLIANSAEVELMCLRQRAGAIEVELRTCRRTASCPHCGTASARIHNRYRRKLADLPWEGVPVRIVLQTRKFFCVRSDCSQRISKNASRAPLLVTHAGAAARVKHLAGWHSHSEVAPEHAWPASSVCLLADRRCYACCVGEHSRYSARSRVWLG